MEAIHQRSVRSVDYAEDLCRRDAVAAIIMLAVHVRINVYRLGMSLG